VFIAPAEGTLYMTIPSFPLENSHTKTSLELQHVFYRVILKENREGFYILDIKTTLLNTTRLKSEGVFYLFKMFPSIDLQNLQHKTYWLFQVKSHEKAG
jgi:hypothetical protein